MDGGRVGVFGVVEDEGTWGGDDDVGKGEEGREETRCFGRAGITTACGVVRAVDEHDGVSMSPTVDGFDDVLRV